MVFTDMVSHAVLGGRYALEHTFIVSRGSLALPAKAPIAILERIAGLIGVVEETPALPATAGTAFSPLPAPETPAPNPSTEAPKKRGFWSRLLGLGKEPDEKPDNDKPKKPGGR